MWWVCHTHCGGCWKERTVADVEMKGWKVGVEVHEVGNGGWLTQEVRKSVENGDLVCWVIFWPFHVQQWAIRIFESRHFKLGSKFVKKVLIRRNGHGWQEMEERWQEQMCLEFWWTSMQRLSSEWWQHGGGKKLKWTMMQMRTRHKIDRVGKMKVHIVCCALDQFVMECHVMSNECLKRQPGSLIHVWPCN